MTRHRSLFRSGFTFTFGRVKTFFRLTETKWIATTQQKRRCRLTCCYVNVNIYLAQHSFRCQFDDWLMMATDYDKQTHHICVARRKMNWFMSSFVRRFGCFKKWHISIYLAFYYYYMFAFMSRRRCRAFSQKFLIFWFSSIFSCIFTLTYLKHIREIFVNDKLCCRRSENKRQKTMERQKGTKKKKRFGIFSITWNELSIYKS